MCDIWPEARVKTSPRLVIHWSPISCLETLSGLVHQTLQWGTCQFLHSQYLILTTPTPELANYNYSIAAHWVMSNWHRSCWMAINSFNEIRQSLWDNSDKLKVAHSGHLRNSTWSWEWEAEAANNWLSETINIFSCQAEFPLSLQSRSKHKQNSISLLGLTRLVREWQIPVFVYLLSSL